LSDKQDKVEKVIVLAAGYGTRFYPLTRAQPKEMLPILDKPVIHYVVEEIVNSGIEKILIVVGKGKESLINYFDSHDLDDKLSDQGINDFPEIFYVRQRKQLGLANAISYAHKFVDSEPFVVLLGDMIYSTAKGNEVVKQLIDVYKKQKCTVIAVEKLPKSSIRDYGIIDGEKIADNMWRVKGAVEKPDPKDAPSDIGIGGAYLFTPEIFDYIKSLKPGRNNEFQITDAISNMAKDHKIVAYVIEGGYHHIGTKESWIETFIDFAKKDKRFKTN